MSNLNGFGSGGRQEGKKLESNKENDPPGSESPPEDGSESYSPEELEMETDSEKSEDDAIELIDLAESNDENDSQGSEGSPDEWSMDSTDCSVDEDEIAYQYELKEYPKYELLKGNEASDSHGSESSSEDYSTENAGAFYKKYQLEYKAYYDEFQKNKKNKMIEKQKKKDSEGNKNSSKYSSSETIGSSIVEEIIIESDSDEEIGKPQDVNRTKSSEICTAQGGEGTSKEEKHATDLEDGKHITDLDEKSVADLEEKSAADLEEKSVADLEQEKPVTDLEDGKLIIDLKEGANDTIQEMKQMSASSSVEKGESSQSYENPSARDSSLKKCEFIIDKRGEYENSQEIDIMKNSQADDSQKRVRYFQYANLDSEDSSDEKEIIIVSDSDEEQCEKHKDVDMIKSSEICTAQGGAGTSKDPGPSGSNNRDGKEKSMAKDKKKRFKRMLPHFLKKYRKTPSGRVQKVKRRFASLSRGAGSQGSAAEARRSRRKIIGGLTKATPKSKSP